MKALLRRIGKNSRPPKSSDTSGEDSSAGSVEAEQGLQPTQLQELASDRDRIGLRLLPLLPLEVVTGVASYDIDVVAVHGLGGDFYRTWTWPRDKNLKQDIFWLSQLLPRELPGARIFSFGYASEWAFSKSVAGIKDYARQLLQALLRYSEDGKRRPTIFVCHSLGGIVVKQALIIAHEENQFAEVLRTTRAIMFMGTPHRGSDIALAVKPLVAFANMSMSLSGAANVTGLMRTDLIKILSRDSAALGDINGSFRHRVGNIIIMSCYELEIFGGLQQRVVEKSSALLQSFNEEQIPLTADHRNMCRFPWFDNENYKNVSAALVRAAQRIAEPAMDSRNTLTPMRSVHSLSESELRYVRRFEERYRVYLDDRVEGTCLWSLRNSQYRAWRNEESSSILWVTGEAGTGKTTLASFLIENLENEASNSRTSKFDQRALVCCFFCNKDIQGQWDASAIIRGLLLQILGQDRDTVKKVRASFDSSRLQFDQSFETLWKIFTFTASIVPCDSLYIIIDALDECEDRTREKLIARVAEMLSMWNKSETGVGTKIKFLVTCQPQLMTTWMAKVQSSFHHYHRLKLEDRPGEMVEDIVRVIDKKVDDLVASLICSETQGDQLKKALKEHAENSFLWVSLVLAHIKAALEFNAGSVKKILTEIPSNLREAYTRYLPPISEQNAELFQKMLRLLLSCSRPLTLDEFHTLHTAAQNPTSHNIGQADPSIMKNVLERAFGPLIRFSSSQIHFAHSTVKDFLLSLDGDATNPLSKTHGTDLPSAHLALATAAMRYLLHDDLSVDLFDVKELTGEQSPTSLSSTATPELVTNDTEFLPDMFSLGEVTFLRDEDATREAMCPQISSRHQAFDYVALHWAHHYAMCEAVAPDELHENATMLAKHGSTQLANWYKYMSSLSRTAMPALDQVSPILIAAMFNHTVNLQNLLKQSPTPSSATRQLALYWAACRGQTVCVRILLEHGAEPDVPCDGHTPLHVAVQGGFVDICDALLATRKVDVNGKNNRSRTPLSLAAEYGHCDILRLLLRQNDIQVNATDYRGRTAFLEAAESGALDCLQVLIRDRRVDSTCTDLRGRDALSHAAQAGKDQIVKLLLKSQNIDCKARDSFGRNPLSYAAEMGHLSTVQQLIQGGFPISQQDCKGRNAISWASNSAKASSGDRCALRLLVKKDREAAGAEDESGWTPLAWAMDPPGYLNAVKILVEDGGVDVNHRDATGHRPALSWAAAEGFVEICEYLLTVPNIEPDLVNNYGRTPLSFAAACGRLEIVRLLLAQQGRVNARSVDSLGRTPADRARLTGEDAVVRELEAAWE